MHFFTFYFVVWKLRFIELCLSTNGIHLTIMSFIEFGWWRANRVIGDAVVLRVSPFRLQIDRKWKEWHLQISDFGRPPVYRQVWGSPQ